jgi:hypothetical protein
MDSTRGLLEKRNAVRNRVMQTRPEKPPQRYAHDAHGRADATGSKLGNERCSRSGSAPDGDAGKFPKDGTGRERSTLSSTPE